MTNKFGELVDTYPAGIYQIEPAAMTSGFEWPSDWSPTTIFPEMRFVMKIMKTSILLPAHGGGGGFVPGFTINFICKISDSFCKTLDFFVIWTYS